MTTRSEHLDWCKKRAMEYCDTGDNPQAFASFISDLRKYDENPQEWSTVIELGMMLNMNGNLSTKNEMKNFIEGTN